MDARQACRNLEDRLDELEAKYDEQIENLYKIIEVFSRELARYDKKTK